MPNEMRVANAYAPTITTAAGIVVMRVPQGKGYNAVNDPRSSREVNSVEASATVNADNNEKDVVIAYAILLNLE